jgi:hypothetical protein
LNLLQSKGECVIVFLVGLKVAFNQLQPLHPSPAECGTLGLSGVDDWTGSPFEAADA